jgi:hypothetical protein
MTLLFDRELDMVPIYQLALDLLKSTEEWLTGQLL